MKKGLSIIIVNYYSENYIIPLVESIVSSLKLKSFEIIIISNSPSKFLWDILYLEKYHIRIYNNDMNNGFGMSVNRGVSYAIYDDFCMLNPDIILNQNTLDTVYNYFQTVDYISAVSCLTLNSDGTQQKSFFIEKKLNKLSFTILYLKKLFPRGIREYLFQTVEESYDFTEPFEVGGFYASFVMLRKKSFIDVGKFDPDFFMYAEDIDFFRTRFSQQYKSILYPFVSLIHLSGKTDKYALMNYQAQVSYLLYLRKAGNYYLFTYVFLLSIKYSLLLVHTLFKQRKDKKEALEFFKSLKYLGKILRYSSRYGAMAKSLKIDEIPD